MKKQSVLIQRALLFTAIVALVAVAVGLPVYLLADARASMESARAGALSGGRALAEAAAMGAEQLTGGAAVFARAGGSAWLCDDLGAARLTGDTPLPEAAAEPIAGALTGLEYLGSARIGGADCALAAIPVYAGDGAVTSAVVAALPVAGGAALAALAGLFAALAAGVGAAVVLAHKMLMPVVRPIAQLRDVAAAVADGNFDARGDERLPGELGGLARALNNVSTQLAHNLYALILERNRLRQMIDGLSEGIVAIDESGHITHLNPALERMFSPPKAAVHLPDPRMKTIPDASVWADFDAVMRSGQPTVRNLSVRDMTVRMTVTPIFDELGATAGAIGLFSDITQMERLERTRREYVSNVSHELRTPLTAMRALIEPLKEGMVASEADRMRYYDIILREVMRLSRLINDQLELSRLQSGTLAIQKSRIRLDDLVYDVCDRYDGIAREHGLELKVLTDFGDCPVVFANADRVEEMLIILLDNAIKYTESGEICVSAAWDDEKVVLTVADTGVGIADEDLPYVFDRFYKVDKAHSGKGSGLGLSIAKELLKRMDEEIWVSSEHGKGTEFSFTIHRPTAADQAS